MRIVSQDGMIDIPYENFVFGITKDNSIVAIRDTVARPSEVCHGIMAEYSTEAKAKKAMEMLRDAYTSSCYSDNGYDYSAQINRPFLFMENRVFHFPQDSEIAE